MKNIFKVAYKKGAKHLLKIEQDGKDVWMNTTETVYNYAKENFEDGDTIGIEYTKNGKLYHVTRVNKDGNSVEKSAEEVIEESKEETISKKDGYFCEDCGKELKDGKYKKCYDCNQKNPEKGKYTQKSPEVQMSIKTQSAYKCASIAIQVFTGQIADIATLKIQLDDLAGHILKKF